MDDVLAGYERLLQRSARMLCWARKGEWAHLIQEESIYVMAVEDLKRLEADYELDSAGLQRKTMLLERIFEQDAEIRQCLEARRNELGRLINAPRRRDLSRVSPASSAKAVPIEQGRR